MVIYVELGCGEGYLAIERILNAVVSNRMTLPMAIFDRLITSTANGSVRTRRVVPPTNLMPWVAGRRRRRFSVTR